MKLSNILKQVIEEARVPKDSTKQRLVKLLIPNITAIENKTMIQ